MVITPTAGRVVWFYPHGSQYHAVAYSHNDAQPMAATVAYVHTERMINLSVTDHLGKQHDFTSVKLVQEGDPIPPLGQAYCIWMPYQLGQAKKNS